MKHLLGLGFLALANTGLTLADDDTPLFWDAILEDGSTSRQEGKCGNAVHVHKALCGRVLLSACQPDHTDPVAVDSSVIAHCKGDYVGSAKVTCPAGGSSDWVKPANFCTQVEVDSTVIKSDATIDDDAGIVDKAAAKAAAKSARDSFFVSVRNAVKRATGTYADADTRKAARKDAKKSRRQQLKNQRDRISGLDWKEAVLVDGEDDEVYTQNVLDKRGVRPIRYRLAPKKTCAEAETLLLQPSSGGLDSIDLEDGGCVKIQVEGEYEVVTIEDKNEGDDDDLYDLTCSHGPSVSGLKASDVFTCGTRVWDVGSLTTDTGCVAHAAYDNNTEACKCNTGYAGVDTDADGTFDVCRLDDDGDGVPDTSDAFPNDASETLDTDGDGVGDNADVFPDDASETLDDDGDGVGDNADGCPNDVAKTAPGDCGCGNAPKANFWCANGTQTEHQKCVAGFGVPAGLVNNLPSDQSFTCETCVGLDHKYSLIEDYSGCADHTKCPEGEEPKAKDGSSNPGCQVCDSESFTTDADYAACTPKTQCTASQYEVSAGSTKTNRVCATKVCTCTDGSPVSALACTTHDTEQCDTCDTGFAKSGVQCLTDTDGDGTADVDDDDDDNDGVLDTADAFPLDSSESVDTDNDGTGDNADTDDDGDGYSDADETTKCDPPSDPKDDSSKPVDTDGDGQCDTLDTDDDNDGVLDGDDAFPLDASESVDTDGDGTGDNADTDDDGDGVLDGDDAFPLDASESVDTDGDGTGDNADTDDDGDGYSDADETTKCDPPSDPKDDSSKPVDTDGDAQCDTLDTDDDGDGVADADDAFPLDASESVDTDGDGTGNNADLDDDGDGVLDADETTDGTDPLDADSYDRCRWATQEGDRTVYINNQCCESCGVQ
jgi:hypothetical protein